MKTQLRAKKNAKDPVNCTEKILGQLKITKKLPSPESTKTTIPEKDKESGVGLTQRHSKQQHLPKKQKAEGSFL